MILQLALVCVASFVWIGLRQIQNLNSIARKYLWMVPTSLMIEVAGVYYVVTVASLGIHWYVIAAVGTGGGLGAMFFTWLHGRRRG